MIFSKFAKDTIWTLVSQIVGLIITLVFNIFAARILGPAEFGVFGLLLFFVNIANIFIEGGLGGALVRKIDVTDLDYSSVFVINLVISVFLYILIFLSSDYISDYYSINDFDYYLKIVSLIFIINALQFTQNAKLIAQLRFREKNILQLLSVILSVVIGFVLLLYYKNLWSMIAMVLSQSLIYTLLLWYKIGTEISFKVSKKSLKSLYSFGLNTTLTNLIIVLFDNINQVVLSKFFSLKITGYYYQAKKLVDAETSLINSLLQGVFYASLVKLQTNIELYVKTYLNILLKLTFVLSFVLVFVFFYADLFFEILFGKEWVPSGKYLIVLVIAATFYFLEQFARITFKVFDTTRVIFRIEIIKKIIYTMFIVYSIIERNIESLLLGFMFTNFLGFSLNFFKLRKLLGDVFIKEGLIMIGKSTISIIVTISLMCLVLYKLDTLSIFCSVPILLFIFSSLSYFTGFFNVLELFRLVFRKRC